VASRPNAELLIHPECGCASAALYMAGEGMLPKERTHILSTGGMVRSAEAADGGEFIVATETGILHKLRKLNPTGRYTAANEAAVCRYMKTITPAKLLHTLREGVYEVTVPQDVAARARTAIERMIAVG
jgi:quinolinate synthase